MEPASAGASVADPLGSGDAHPRSRAGVSGGRQGAEPGTGADDLGEAMARAAPEAGDEEARRGSRGAAPTEAAIASAPAPRDGTVERGAVAVPPSGAGAMRAPSPAIPGREPAASASAAGGVAQSPATPPVTGAAPDAGEDGAIAADDGLRSDAPRGAGEARELILFPRWVPEPDDPDAASPGDGPSAPGTAGAGGPGERLAALLADDRAVERATDRIDRYWQTVRHHLERDWEVDKEILREGPTRGLGIDVEAGIRSWLEEAAAYGATGNPYGEGPMVPGAPGLPDHLLPLDRQGQQHPGLPRGGERSAFRRERSALVLLVQDDRGRVVEIRLHRSSGNLAFDDAALAQARRLSRLDLGVPPDGRKSLWSFDATLAITPPAPIAGCSFDAHFLPDHCFYPLSERVKHAVRLVGVWDADETPGIR